MPNLPKVTKAIPTKKGFLAGSKETNWPKCWLPLDSFSFLETPASGFFLGGCPALSPNLIFLANLL